MPSATPVVVWAEGLRREGGGELKHEIEEELEGGTGPIGTGVTSSFFDAFYILKR